MSGYPPDLEAYVEQKVQSGEFPSREEFTAEAVRVYRELEQRHRALKSDVAAALDQARRGEAAPFDLEAIKRELTNHLDEQGNAR